MKVTEAVPYSIKTDVTISCLRNNEEGGDSFKAVNKPSKFHKINKRNSATRCHLSSITAKPTPQLSSGTTHV
ncbi:hypothetical protein SK128_007294 [Halocaridina rubra]|uniref:Uncharacterized protein n=1 Tax=Halocaridina rubra TaxID=373956 RepID=A0AAN8ZPI3_HALRR